MTYGEAITLLKQGNEEGFKYLYDTTYKTCLYVIGEIVKDRMEAEDILQDAYMRAIQKIDTLKEPEKFPAWFKTIASRLAFNYAKKNKRTVIIDPGEDESPEAVMDRMINEKAANNQITPEEIYECRETNMLLREMIGNLPEKQKQCIILFYIEDCSIKDIAEACNCNENTVKSRLKYGRRKLEEKTTELQNKGYVLQGVAPVYLITWLLKTDMSYKMRFVYSKACTAEFAHTLFAKLADAGIIAAVNSGLASAVNSGMTVASDSAIAGTAAKGVASAAVKGGIHTVTGKIITGAVVAAVTGGLVTAAVVTNNNNKTEEEVTTEVTATVTEEVTSSEAVTTEITSEEITTEEIIDDGYTEMTEDDYARLICGNLSMSETEIMLECVCATNGNSSIAASEIEKVDYINIMITDYADELSLDVYDEIDYQKVYYTDKINNLLEAVQIPLLTAANYDYWLSDEWMQFFIDSELIFENTDDGILIGDYFIGMLPYVSSVEIISAKYNDEEMRIIFKLYRINQDLDETTVCKYENYEEAVLLKNDSGRYYLSEIHEYNDTINDEATDTYSSEVLEAWKETYKDILENNTEWGVDTYLFNYESFGIDIEYLESQYETVTKQYALIYSANETIPYLAIKVTCKDRYYDAEYYDGDYNLWYIYKYDKNDDSISCFCDLNDPGYIYSDGYSRELLIYNNKLAWYVKYNGETHIYNLCIYDDSDSSLDSVSENELSAAKDKIIYHDITDTSAIDNY